MSQARHTPGPWRVNKYGGIGAGLLGADPVVASVEPFYGSDEKHGSDLANARLIAAAPELLEALEDAAVELELCAWEDGVMVNARAEDAAKDVRAAIAKATRGVA